MSNEVTYKLVDKEGFFNSFPQNKDLYIKYEKDGCFTGVFGDKGGLYLGEGLYDQIDDVELDAFFEEVPITKQTEPVLWHGESPLEVGMVVKDYRREYYVVEMVEATQVILRKENGLLAIAYIENLERAKPSPKEETFEKFLSQWHRKGLDFAYDNKNSTAKLGDMFDVLYDVMNKENEVEQQES